MGNQIRTHLIVSGRVQGVLFRQSARARALELGITGWAHNLLDGRVEIVCEGETEKMRQFMEWCKRGPLLAKVGHIDVVKEEYTGEFQDFSIREFGF